MPEPSFVCQTCGQGPEDFCGPTISPAQWFASRLLLQNASCGIPASREYSAPCSIFDGSYEDSLYRDYHSRQASAPQRQRDNHQHPETIHFRSPRGQAQSVADRIKTLNERSGDAKSQISQSRSSLRTRQMDRQLQRPRGEDTRSSMLERGNNDESLTRTEHRPIFNVIQSPMPQRLRPEVLNHAFLSPGAAFVDRAIHNPAPSTAARSVSPDGKPMRPPAAGPSYRAAYCERHAKALRVVQQPEHVTLDRPLGGAYVASGRRLRHQVEAAIPYYAHDDIAHQDMAVLPCSDCLAEAEIRSREVRSSLERQSKPPLRSVRSDPNTISSTLTEPGTPIQESLTGPSTIGTADDNQHVLLPGTAVSGMSLCDDKPFVTADLGDMVDAIIIEHRGTLDKVITNLRNGVSQLDDIKRISGDLSVVSTSMSTISSVAQPKATSPSTAKYSVILDAPQEFVRSKTKSVKDIIQYLDAAAKDLGVPLSGSSRLRGNARHGPSNPVGTKEEHNDTSAGMRSLAGAGDILRERAAIKSLAPLATDRGQPISEAFLVAGPNPGDPPAPRTNSPLIIAANVPGVMPASIPVPVILPTDAKAAEGDLVDQHQGPVSPEPQAAPAKQDIGGKTDRTADVRVDEPGHSSRAAGSEVCPPAPESQGQWRRRRSRAFSLAYDASHASSGSAGAVQRADTKLDRQQGTFAQPFVKDLARDSAMRERVARRWRVDHANRARSA